MEELHLNFDIRLSVSVNRQQMPANRLLELQQFKCEINEHNALYLAGKVASPPRHDIVEKVDQVKSSDAISDDDKRKIIGDVSDQLPERFDIILACTDNFRKAGELARILGFRPVKAGEFIQILWLLLNDECYLLTGKLGWFFCYEGRLPEYAILANFWQKNIEITFDTHIPCLENVQSNANNIIVFININQKTTIYFYSFSHFTFAKINIHRIRHFVVFNSHISSRNHL